MALVQANAQIDRDINQIDEEGNVSTRSGNFNKHSKDSTNNKEIPKGLYTWTIDRRFGDVIPAQPDTLPHLFMNTTFNSGMYGDYNTTGSNYTARQSRIFIDRPYGDYFIFTEPYSFVNKMPDNLLFMNTLSPYTSVLYDNCGDKTNGEDHIDAKFAVNANKRLNFGFDLDYTYARGYYSNQNISHFNGTLFGSYLGDRYQMHFFFNAAHQKASENGGITTDTYITHPESYTDNYTESEIPTVLSKNWNRNDHQHLFLSHRYNIGFYRMVKMTDEEIKARQFAKESMKAQEAKKEQKNDNERDFRKDMPAQKPTGRPEGAKVIGKEPQRDSLNIAADTTRIKVEGQAAIDSLNRLQAIQDSIDATMKREYVPVTSFIHTLDFSNYNRIYQAYSTPTDYYQNTYYTQGLVYGNDSIYDQVKHQHIKNTLALALLEGFNKYVKAGLKVFISHEHSTYQMPELENDILIWNKWKEYNLTFGAQLNKTQGKTLHFNLTAERWLSGADAGDMTVDFSTDLNFPLFGDTVQLAASASYQRCNPVFLQSTYHSKHIWWDNNFDRETRTRIEGLFSYQKTNTKLRVAAENIKNYTYYGMSYDLTDSGRKNMTAGVYQEGDNIQVLTAQLHQNFRLGPLNWENIITYQKSSNNEVLPLPDLNIFTNLYLKFKIAKVLGVELGADATYFTKYYAPDFCPAINQFAVQKNADSRVELGEFPFVDVYANMTLKGVRFFLVMTNVVNSGANHMKFLTPHYPTNGSVLHFGVSWPFFN